MLLFHGDTTQLLGKDWYAIELRTEKATEAVLRRVAMKIPAIFREEPVEVFIPVGKRDLEVFEMRLPYVFVHTTDTSLLMRIGKGVQGIEQVLCKGDQQRASHALQMEDDYIQELIRSAEEDFRFHSDGVQEGSFVRILSSQMRDFCGHVDAIVGDTAVVRVDLKTKQILIETPVINLLNLDSVPADRRVFYYGPLVAELEDTSIIAEDLRAVMEEPKTPEETWERMKKNDRARTVTRFVSVRLSENPTLLPLEISRLVVEGLQQGILKKPKSLFIIYNIIKAVLMKSVFKDVRPYDFRSVGDQYPEYKFKLAELAELAKEMGYRDLPRETPWNQKCTDGRSREARRKNKLAKAAALVAQKLAERRKPSPEAYARQVEGIRAYHARRKAEKKPWNHRQVSAETKAKLSQSLKAYFTRLREKQTAPQGPDQPLTPETGPQS